MLGRLVRASQYFVQNVYIHSSSLGFLHTVSILWSDNLSHPASRDNGRTRGEYLRHRRMNILVFLCDGTSPQGAKWGRPHFCGSFIAGCYRVGECRVRMSGTLVLAPRIVGILDIEVPGIHGSRSTRRRLKQGMQSWGHHASCH